MKHIAYVVNEALLKECNRIPMIRNRASMVHSLILAYGLLGKMNLIQPKEATVDELALFHSTYYLNYLSNNCRDADNSDDDYDSGDDVDEEQLNYGLGYDCPKLRNLFRFAKIISGATITAADLLISDWKYAINWCGGWHHAQRDEAEGFCYINDIAIGIERLRSKFQRVLYIDLDVHHGNGVENAYAYTKRVFTLSFHQYAPGYFPGTGTVQDCGYAVGQGYCANFPYNVNITGDLFVKYFLLVTQEITRRYSPDVCVIQCGGDVITGDPLGGTNLTPKDIGVCIKKIISWDLPTMFLGGGGYNLSNTSRYWTYLTALICGEDDKLNDEIPDHDYFLKYGPGYELTIDKRNIKDTNSESDLSEVLNTIKENLDKFHVHAC